MKKFFSATHKQAETVSDRLSPYYAAQIGALHFFEALEENEKTSISPTVVAVILLKSMDNEFPEEINMPLYLPQLDPYIGKLQIKQILQESKDNDGTLMDAAYKFIVNLSKIYPKENIAKISFSEKEHFMEYQGLIELYKDKVSDYIKLDTSSLNPV